MVCKLHGRTIVSEELGVGPEVEPDSPIRPSHPNLPKDRQLRKKQKRPPRCIPPGRMNGYCKLIENKAMKQIKNFARKNNKCGALHNTANPGDNDDPDDSSSNGSSNHDPRKHNKPNDDSQKQIKKAGSILSTTTLSESRKMTNFSKTDKLGQEIKNYHVWRMVLEGLFEMNRCMEIILGICNMPPNNTPKSLDWRSLHNYAYAQITLSLHPNFLASLLEPPRDTNRVYSLWSQIAKLKKQLSVAHKLFHHKQLHEYKMCKGTNIAIYIKIMKQ